ncbi:MAG: hypothetical protein WDM71_10995 [Ferruginibacter sp.]
MDIIYIILFIIFIRKTGTLAIQKGLKPWVWRLYMAIAWVIAGSIGSGFAINYLGIDIQPAKSLSATMNDMLNLPEKDLWIISSLSLFFAFGGYLLIRAILERKPDRIDKDIDKIGSDDLKPPMNQ